MPLDPATTEEKTDIEYFMTLGDSLSDRGTLKKRKLFGIIPMDFLAGLSGRSPKGRFTNGFTWDDHLAAMIASELDTKAIHRQERELERDERADDKAADEADEIIAHQRRTEQTLRKHAYTLDDDLHVHYHGENLLDSYNEGGLTSHPYRNTSEGTMGWSASRYFSRKILSTLPEKRKKALAYADRHNLSETHRKKTLVMEWSGANDLFTVNDFATPQEVDAAIDERIHNVLEMAKAGYRRFMLMDLPDLSKTPHYQNQLPKPFRGLNIDFSTNSAEVDLSETTEEKIQGITFTKLKDGRYLLSDTQLQQFQKLSGGLEVSNAQLASREFNRKLAEKRDKVLPTLNEICKDDPFSFDIFPVSDLFDKVYLDPEAYNFKKDKIHEPYTKSADYKKKGSHHIKDAHGHMFWDDVHPSAHMHKLLAEKAYEFIEQKYNFIDPISKKKDVHQSSLSQLVSNFHTQYAAKRKIDQAGFFSGLRKYKLKTIPDDPQADLKNILRHALFEGGDRTLDLIKALKWFDGNGKSFGRSDITCGCVHSKDKSVDSKCKEGVHSPSLIIEKALHDVVNEKHAKTYQKQHGHARKLH